MATTEERGTLKEKEAHPASESALAYLKGLGLEKLSMWQECFSSCAIEGNRLGEICSETLYRLMNGKPVSDRYLLGLAWIIKKGETNEPDCPVIKIEKPCRETGKHYKVTDGKGSYWCLTCAIVLNEDGSVKDKE